MIPESLAVQGVITGAITAGYAVAALFFLRFWRQTRDRLFAAFAAAFLLLALANPLPLLANVPSEDQAPIYLLRLFAFLLIILAVLRKNMESRR